MAVAVGVALGGDEAGAVAAVLEAGATGVALDCVVAAGPQAANTRHRTAAGTRPRNGSDFEPPSRNADLGQPRWVAGDCAPHQPAVNVRGAEDHGQKSPSDSGEALAHPLVDLGEMAGKDRIVAVALVNAQLGGSSVFAVSVRYELAAVDGDDAVCRALEDEDGGDGLRLGRGTPGVFASNAACHSGRVAGSAMKLGLVDR